VKLLFSEVIVTSFAKFNEWKQELWHDDIRRD